MQAAALAPRGRWMLLVEVTPSAVSPAHRAFGHPRDHFKRFPC